MGDVLVRGGAAAAVVLCVLMVGVAGAEVEPVTPEEIRASIGEYFGAGPARVLDPQVEIVEKVDEADHQRWLLRYVVDEDEYGQAYLLMPRPLPTADNPRPLVLALHPTSGGGKEGVVGIYDAPATTPEEIAKREARGYAIDLVRRGFIVFAPDRAGFGRRTLLESGSVTEQMNAYRDYLAERYPAGFKLTSGKVVWDLQRALDFLVDYDFVDTDNIGAIGYSLGAWDSLMLIGMDERIKAAAINCGGTLSFRPELWRDPQALRDFVENPARQNLHTNANLWLRLAAPRSVLYIWSIQDQYDKAPNIIEGFRDITAHWENVSGEKATPQRADVSLYLQAYGHAFPIESRLLAYQWLETRLGLNPDTK